MSQIGRKVLVGLAKETTRGTAVATAGCWPAVTDNGVQDKIEKVRNTAALGVIEAGHESHVAKEWGEGDIKGLITDKTVAWLFMWLFGQESVAANTPTSGVTTRTYNVKQDAKHQSMTVLLNDEQLGDRAYALAMMSSFEINIEPGKEVEFSLNYKSKKGAAATVTTSLTAENTFLSRDAILKLATNAAGLNAASAVQTLRKLVLKFEKNVEEDYRVGGTGPSEIYNKEFSVSGTLDLALEDATYRDLALSDAVRALRVTVPIPTVTIGTSTNPSFELSFNKVSFSEFSLERGLGDIVMQALSFEAEFSVADGKMVEGRVINNVASV